jgi:hypothetical protein
LTPGEITSTVEKIRRRYDEYVTKYFKPRGLREAFETRYLRALRSGVDVSAFLLAEISAIEELVEREDQRIQAGPLRPAASAPRADFAERVLQENRKRISPYPDIRFHADAGEEVRRLVGALTQLARESWGDIAVALGDTMYAMGTSEMLALDSQLRYLGSPGGEEPPSYLARLMSELRRFPRNYPSIEREEKEYVLEAAFFLNDLLVVMDRVLRVYTDMAAEKRSLLEKARAWTWDVVTAFRLKDLKRRRGARRAE